MIVLDDRFHVATRRWPVLNSLLHQRMAQQTHRATEHLALLHIPRAEDRILALFVDLAERLGHVTRHGVVIDLVLSQELIGQLVGSKRPTVSLNLDRLARSGSLVRLLRPCVPSGMAARMGKEGKKSRRTWEPT